MEEPRMGRSTAPRAYLVAWLSVAGCTGQLGQDDEAHRHGGAGNGNSTGTADDEPRFAGPFMPGRPVLRRLTAAQFSNSIRDVLGVDLPAGTTLEVDSTAEIFTEVGAGGGSISDLGTERYSTAAVRASSAAFESAAKRATLLPCSPNATADADCARKVVEQIGERLWRRPLTAAEVGNMTAILTDAATRVNSFYQGAALTVAGMI